MQDSEQDVWSWGVAYMPNGSWVLLDEPLVDDQDKESQRQP